MRRRTGSETGSLDSLTDTMTNVVGILIVVVAVAQLNVVETVQRIKALELMKDVPKEVAIEALREKERLEVLLSKIKAVYGSLVSYHIPENMTVEDIKRLIPNLQMVAEDPTVLPPRSHVPILEKVIEMEVELGNAQNELELRKAMLDARYKDAQAAEITLPERRGPGQRQPVFFICRDGVIYPFNARQLNELLQNTIRSVLNVNGPNLMVAPQDFPRLELHFDSQVVGDDYTRLRLKNLQDSLLLVFEPQTNIKQLGEQAGQLVTDGSAYAKALKQIDPRRQFIQFHVWGDSFPVYIQARKMADAAGIAAGWEPYANGEPLQHRITGEGKPIKPVGDVD